MSKLPIKGKNGSSAGEYDLADTLLVYDKGMPALHGAVIRHQANQRAGTASTLTKAEVRGSGKKQWKQKGTGRARSHYRRSPVWRGGGVAFGPKPRDFSIAMNRKEVRLAFRRAFSEKVAAGEILVVENLSIDEAKTKKVAELIKSLGLGQGTLLVTSGVDRNLVTAARNLPKTEVATAQDVNTYQLLRYPAVVVAKDAMAIIEGRLQAPLRRSV